MARNSKTQLYEVWQVIKGKGYFMTYQIATDKLSALKRVARQYRVNIDTLYVK